MSATSRKASLPSSEALRAALAGGARAAPWLQRHFGISQPSLSRVMAAAFAVLPELHRFGRGKSTLYALTLPDAPDDVWFETAAGVRHDLGALHRLVADQWLFAPRGTGTPALTQGEPPWLAVLHREGPRLPGRFGVGGFSTTPDALPPVSTAAGAGLPSVPAVRERLQDLAVAQECLVGWLRAARVPVEGVAGWPLAAVEPGLPAVLRDALPKAARRGSLGAGTLQALRWLADFAACIGDELREEHLRFAADGAAARRAVPPWPGLPNPQPLAWRSRPLARVAAVHGLFPRCYLPTAAGELPAQALEPPATGGVRAARHAAERFWRQLAQEERVSFGFRLVAAANARKLAPAPAKNRN